MESEAVEQQKSCEMTFSFASKWQDDMKIGLPGSNLQSALDKRQVNGQWCMFCLLCLQRVSDGTIQHNKFTVGCPTFKRDMITRHLRSSHSQDMASRDRSVSVSQIAQGKYAASEHTSLIDPQQDRQPSYIYIYRLRPGHRP